MALAKKLDSKASQKHPVSFRAFLADHEDAIWAVVLALGLLLLSIYSG